LSLRKRLCQTLGFLKLSSGHMSVFKKTKRYPNSFSVLRFLPTTLLDS
jgi:hypothetical protein